MFAALLEPAGHQHKCNDKQHHSGYGRRRKAELVITPVWQSAHQKHNQYDQQYQAHSQLLLSVLVSQCPPKSSLRASSRHREVSAFYGRLFERAGGKRRDGSTKESKRVDQKVELRDDIYRDSSLVTADPGNSGFVTKWFPRWRGFHQ